MIILFLFSIKNNMGYSWKIQYVSDLHLEFEPELRDFSTIVVPTGNVLILVGDVCIP